MKPRPQKHVHIIPATEGYRTSGKAVALCGRTLIWRADNFHYLATYLWHSESNPRPTQEYCKRCKAKAAEIRLLEAADLEGS
jgi:hypothetical protein